MHAVIFEALPKPQHLDAYLALAGRLRPALEQVDGFLENRRFRSRRRPGWLLSLSTWRDEAALLRWRGHAPHRAAQRQGRAEIFEDYRLRVVHEPAGDALPPGRSLVTIVERRPTDGMAEGMPVAALEELSAVPGLAGWDLFEGLQAPDDLLVLLDWHGQPAGPDGWAWPGSRFAVLRDYGLSRRDQAPADGGAAAS